MDGLLRVSVVSGTGPPLDLALPAHVAVAEILPELIRLGRAPAAAQLVTVTGQEVASATSLAAQAVPDGAVLALVEPEPSRTGLDDPAQALAAAVGSDVLGWHPRLLRPGSRAIGALLLLLAAGALARGPAWSGAIAAAGVVALVGAASAAQRQHDRLLSAGCGWAAVGFAAVAGAQYAGPVAACAAAVVSAVVIARVVRAVARLVLPAAVAALVLGALASLVVWCPVDPALAAAVGLVGAGITGSVLPQIALGIARGDATAARELMRALMAAAAVVLLVLVVPTAAHGGAGAGLAVAVGIHTACRASRHHGAVEVVSGLATGAAMVLLAGVVLVMSGSGAAGVVGAVGLLGALGLGVYAARDPEQRREDPRLAIAVDRLESLALLATVPLLVFASGVVPLLAGLVRG
ncbi:EsaB/YukD family protein [Nocardioides jejuensis]|uniref:EccD-like transmembrane domain-containing protein n=1 Tax=Nocardioides jejuensis TaxID=2502782 RepID=A0A4R1CHM0_9ACTN|nr:EsaB/YukD family protein [Nocardioides jejuensis]TCJ29428.1 hypothetical protein EPD65_06820 [Nocardioides jejuensis]